MEFELSLDSAAAGRLARLPAIAPRPGARVRPTRRRVVWHDSPDRALAAAGFALTEERGAWRLERLLPGEQDWPPAAPATAIAQDADASRLGVTLPAGLAPVVAFDGQASDHALSTDHGPVAVRRLRGVLRTVTTESPAARLLLTGPDPAVLAAAHLLADALDGAVPRCTWAAEALAMADGQPPPPRRLGPPELPGDCSVAAAFAHALGHLADVILYHAPRAAAGRDGPDPVHQMRVAVRRLRSALAIFRAVLPAEQVAPLKHAIGGLAAVLGPVRDWDVFVLETAPSVQAALPEDTRLVRLIAAAERRRGEAHAALAGYLAGPAFRRLGIELAWLAGGRDWQAALPEEARAALDQELSGFAAQVLQRRHKRLRGAGAEIADLDIAGLHALRLRGKRMRYAAEILAPAFPGKPARRFIDRLATLQARLGHLNDRAVAAELLGGLGGPGGRHGYAVGVVTGALARDGMTIRPRIERAWEKFLRQPAFWA